MRISSTVAHTAIIIGTNIEIKIQLDRKINMTSRMLTMKKAPPPGRHVFQPIVTIFKLIQDIIETYMLAKFYEDWNINVASTELTRQIFKNPRPVDEFVGSLPTRRAISLSPLQTPSTGSSQETDSTMSTSAYNKPSCNIEEVEINVKLLPGF
ncbi:hypothetical protein DPMN_084156 [Dreissena polymorpha]|uniref:Uncharacterized protein n=1 Tax=Dreissena polymorpha TaxID=45954 RepID=A0A9D3YAK1_DREPO|nr:hypothetical protein DPMN_084156 [Dreissena polymorpha]